MKTNTKQNTAWRNLFFAILIENGYYESIRQWANKNEITLKALANDFYNHMDEIPNGMGPYYYLDTFEDNIAREEVWKMTTIGEIIDYIYDHSLWKE